MRSGFKATGLVPPNPDEILPQLHVQTRTPSPPIRLGVSQSSWTLETPHNVRQLKLPTEVVRGEKVMGDRIVENASPDQPKSSTNQPCYHAHTTYLTLPRYQED